MWGEDTNPWYISILFRDFTSLLNSLNFCGLFFFFPFHFSIFPTVKCEACIYLSVSSWRNWNYSIKVITEEETLLCFSLSAKTHKCVRPSWQKSNPQTTYTAGKKHLFGNKSILYGSWSVWCGTGLTLRLTEILEGLPVKPAGLCLLYFCIFLFFRVFFFYFRHLQLL